MRLGKSLKKVGDGLRNKFGSSAAVKRIVALTEMGGTDAFDELFSVWTTEKDSTKDAAAEGLLQFDEPSLWEPLWLRWAEAVDHDLGDLLKERNVESQDDALCDRSMLKLSREDEMPTDGEFAGTIMAFRDDPDLDVRRAATRYWRRLETINPDAYVHCCLLLGTYAKIGTVRDAVDRVLGLRKHPQLDGDRIEGYRRSLARRDAIYWDLRLELAGKIRMDIESRTILAEFAGDEDEDLRVQARNALERLKAESLTHYLWAILKLGETPQTTVAAIKTVATLVHDEDLDVAKDAMNWLAGLPDAPRENGCLYDVWIDADDRDSLRWLLTSGRCSEKVSDRLLATVLCDGEIEPIETGESLATLLVEGWTRANTRQRDTFMEAIETRGDRSLVDAYEQAFGARRDFDIQRFMRALIAVEADDKLYSLLPRLNFAQGLQALKRWEQSGWRPQRQDDREFVATLCEALGGLTEETIVNSAGVAWFDRYADALTGPAADLDTAGIVWIELAAGSVPELLAAPLSGDPDEVDDYLAAKKVLDSHPKPLPARLSKMFDLLLLFRRRYATTIEVFEVQA